MPRDVPPDPETDQKRPFPEAQSVHDRILSSPDDHPEGWVEQAQFRERYGLPPFRPPRFRDSALLDETIGVLELEVGVDIEIVARDVHREGWAVEVDGRRAFRFEHHRDDAANTVVEMTSTEFEAAIERVVRDRR